MQRLVTPPVRNLLIVSCYLDIRTKNCSSILFKTILSKRLLGRISAYFGVKILVEFVIPEGSCCKPDSRIVGANFLKEVNFHVKSVFYCCSYYCLLTITWQTLKIFCNSYLWTILVFRCNSWDFQIFRVVFIKPFLSFSLEAHGSLRRKRFVALCCHR